MAIHLQLFWHVSHAWLCPKHVPNITYDMLSYAGNNLDNNCVFTLLVTLSRPDAPCITQLDLGLNTGARLVFSGACVISCSSFSQHLHPHLIPNFPLALLAVAAQLTPCTAIASTIACQERSRVCPLSQHCCSVCMPQG